MFKNSLCLIQNIKTFKKNTTPPPLCFTVFSLETNPALTADQELAVTASLKHWLYNPLVSTQIKTYIHKFHIVKIRTSGSFVSGNTCTSSVSGQKVKGGICPKKSEGERVWRGVPAAAPIVLWAFFGGKQNKAKQNKKASSCKNRDCTAICTGNWWTGITSCQDPWVCAFRTLRLATRRQITEEKSLLPSGL